VFGDGFGPTDVFKAWWGAAEDLASSRTVQAFRHRLVGTTGVRATWRALRDVPADQLSVDEVWVYGCELLRELSRIEIEEGPDASAKRALLADEMSPLRADLEGLALGHTGSEWLATVSRFYGIGGSHAGA
jgi:hypothetical protein